MSPTKDASAAVSQTIWANGAAAVDESALARQYVSDRMAAGIAFATSDTIKCYIRCAESATNDNINRQPICVKVVSEDGNTLRATLKALGHYGPNTTEWIVTTLTAKTLADGDTLGAGYTTVLGDRLVIEVGGQVSSAGGTTVTGTMSFGANTTDLLENETGTTALDPWFEISRTVTFAPTAYTLTADSGTFTEAGTAATLKYGRLVGAGSGTFAHTGTAATLKVGHKLTADSGSFSETGTAATLTPSGVLTVTLKQGATTIASWPQAGPPDSVTLAERVLDAGEVALINQPADGVSNTALSVVFSANHRQMRVTWVELEAPAVDNAAVLSADSGTFVLTGTAAGLRVTRTLAAGSGTFTETGTDAALKVGHRLDAGSGTFVETGTAAGLLFGRKVVAGSGTFTETGTSAGLLTGRKVSAASGSYTWTGSDATLTYTGSGPTNYTLTAGAGSFGLTGTSAGLLATRLVPPRRSPTLVPRNPRSPGVGRWSPSSRRVLWGLSRPCPQWRPSPLLRLTRWSSSNGDLNNPLDQAGRPEAVDRCDTQLCRRDGQGSYRSYGQVHDAGSRGRYAESRRGCCSRWGSVRDGAL
jgi:hypothetical protein